MNNRIHYPFLLSLTVIGLLLLLLLVGKFSVGDVSFRKIDLLSDIRLEEEEEQPAAMQDSTLAQVLQTPDSVKTQQDSVIHEVIERCPPNVTCIEDYSADGSALADFVGALSEARAGKHFLRIAFYGDSFIEGDVFCGSFRDTLQTVFGGRGVGYVPVTSNVTGFRNTIKHKFENWTTSSLVERTSDRALGPAGFTFIPEQGNALQYRPSKQRYLRSFNNIRLYYSNPDSAIMHYAIDTMESSEALKISERMQEWKFQGTNLKRVDISFDPYDSLSVYGLSFEGPPGVYVDNFSIRGNSGLNLNRISSAMLGDFNRFRNYKLIILQFGLNLVGEEDLNYEAYVNRMVGAVNRMKGIFPNTSFLLLSISDRSTNTDGTLKTMEAITVMRDAQRLIAQQSGIAFWDMFAAMGGSGSMIKWVNATPPLGARDYTHLTFRGGKVLAGRLAKSLLVELKHYEKPQ